VQVYGIVDSIREGQHRSCFSRYQYPSPLPERVTSRMIEAVSKVLTHMGYDNSPFNAEFYWDKSKDKIWSPEINSRISKSHCSLFKMVDGEYYHAVMIDVALGRRPDFPCRQGRHKVAAKFLLRHCQDGVVVKTPSRDDMDKVRQRFPDCDIQCHVQPGMRLSDLQDQDSYSYEIAVLFMGAASQKDLLENYRRALELLPFDIQPFDIQQDGQGRL
jgi:biotin carboxylase